jgi:hypothetical protein
VNPEDDYSEVADTQLDELEVGPDIDRYNAVMDTCELVFRSPEVAHSMSSAITTTEGIRFRLPVADHPPYKVFWSSDAPRIEAVFAHP